MKKNSSEDSKNRFYQVWFTFKQVFLLSWRSNPKFLIAALVLNTLSGALIYPLLILEKAFIDQLIESVGTDFWTQSAKTLILILSLALISRILRDLMGRISRFLSRMMSRDLSNVVLALIAKKNAELDMSVLEDPQFKDVYNRVERDGSRRPWQMMMPFTSVPMSLAGIISTLILIASFHPLIVLIILVLSVPEFYASAILIRKEYWWEKKMSTSYKTWGWLRYYLTKPRNMLEIKLLGLSVPFSKRLRKIQDTVFEGRFKLGKEGYKRSFLSSLPQDFFLFLTGIYLAFSAVSRQITIGSAQMLFRAINEFRSSVGNLLRDILEVYDSYLYVKDLVWLLEIKPKISLNEDGEKLADVFSSGIEFKNVWFKYKEKSPWILKDVSFKVSLKENLALVGQNGAGKTTLVKLLCRFYDPQKGQILVDGVDIRKYSTESLWQNFSVLFQDFERYAFSARESIGYADSKRLSSVKKIHKAAERAGIDDYIRSLPKGYETPLSRDFEDGTDLSTGQWQKIAISRAFFRDAPIVVLDEPTSNVDPKAEEEIFEKLIDWAEKKMLILISHRFSTVRKADKIIVLENGKVMEEGNHETLLKNKKVYAELFEAQAKNYR